MTDKLKSAIETIIDESQRLGVEAFEDALSALSDDLATGERGDDIWIPKSRCEIYPQTPVRGQFVTLTSDEQTLTEKGLV